MSFLLLLKSMRQLHWQVWAKYTVYNNSALSGREEKQFLTLPVCRHRTMFASSADWNRWVLNMIWRLVIGRKPLKLIVNVWLLFRGEPHSGWGEGFCSLVAKVGALAVWGNDAVRPSPKLSINFPHEKKKNQGRDGQGEWEKDFSTS